MVKLYKKHPVTEADCHLYLDEEKPQMEYISISEFVKKYIQEKSSEQMAMGAYANPNSKWFNYPGGIPAILQAWEVNKNASCERGTAIHNELEAFHEEITPELMEKKHIVTFANLTESSFIRNENTHDILEQAFCADLTDKKGIAGTPDWVRYYLNNDGTILVDINDYKTDKVIKRTPTFANERSMLGPLAGIPATSYHIYAVKMTIYFFFLQKYLSQKYNVEPKMVQLQSMTIYHWVNENWTVIQLPDYRAKVRNLILEYKQTLLQ